MRLRKLALLGAGFVFLAIGAIGVAVPVLPTTPFVLLAALCFAKSSPRASEALRSSRYFGSYVENYQNGTGVPIRRKLQAIAFLWTGLLASVVVVRSVKLGILLALVGIAVTTHLVLIRPKGVAKPSEE